VVVEVLVVFAVLVLALAVLKARLAAEAGQAEAGQVESGGRSTEPAAEPTAEAAKRAKLALLKVDGGVPRVAHRRQHEVRDGRGGLRRVRGVDHAWVNRDVKQLANAVDHRPNGTAPGRPGQLAVGELLLRAQRLLSGREDLLHVKAARSHNPKPTCAHRRFSQFGQPRCRRRKTP